MSFSFSTNPRVFRRKFCTDESFGEVTYTIFFYVGRHLLLLQSRRRDARRALLRVSSHQVNPPVFITTWVYTYITTVIKIMIKAVHVLNNIYTYRREERSQSTGVLLYRCIGYYIKYYDDLRSDDEYLGAERYKKRATSRSWMGA